MHDHPSFFADIATCATLLRAGSKSFAAAAMLLPGRVRAPATALYAFCRLADDAVDLSDDSAGALADLHHRLAKIYAGMPLDQPADRAFADVVARHDIPRALPEALLEGFAWDSNARIYETLADVEAYSVRVAGTVGMMMALIMGAKSPEGLARACDLGVAMQLTNIARDVGEDARAGRLYLPRQWLREAGIDPVGFLRNPLFTPALGEVVARLLAAASVLYRHGKSGIAALPLDCRPAIHGARLIYADIGREIAHAGFDTLSQRARVSGARKCVLLAHSVLASLVPHSNNGLPAMVAARPLMAALMLGQNSGPEGKIARVIEVFAQLGERPRRAASQRQGRFAAAK